MFVGPGGVRPWRGAVQRVREDLPATRRARRHRRRPSRRVRLRRTITGAVLLILVAVVTVRLTTGPDEPLLDAAGSAPRVTTSAPTTAGATQTPNNEDGSSTTETATAGAAKVPQNGNGKISVVAVPQAAVATTGRTVKYTVEIEGGLGVDPAQVAATVQSVLLDPQRSCAHKAQAARAPAEAGALRSVVRARGLRRRLRRRYQGAQVARHPRSRPCRSCEISITAAPAAPKPTPATARAS